MGSLSKKELNDQLKKANDSSKLALQEMKTEKETLTVQHESEVSTLNNELQVLKDQVIGKDERYESLNWKKGELEKQLTKLKGDFDEEMSEMVDVVNDLKVKEEELGTLDREMKNKNNKIDELCKQLLQQEQSHKENLRKKEKLAEEEVKAALSKLDMQRIKLTI